MDQHISPDELTVLPVATADRIKSIDSIRGFALLGILMMNINVFGINWDFWYKVSHGPHTGVDFYSFMAIFVFFEGTMRGLFSMLFGAGMILFMMSAWASLCISPAIALWNLLIGVC